MRFYVNVFMPAHCAFLFPAVRLEPKTEDLGEGRHWSFLLSLRFGVCVCVWNVQKIFLVPGPVQVVALVTLCGFIFVYLFTYHYTSYFHVCFAHELCWSVPMTTK